MKIFKNSIQIKKMKYWSLFDDLIAHMLSNKRLNPIVTELYELQQIQINHSSDIDFFIYEYNRHNKEIKSI